LLEDQLNFTKPGLLNNNILTFKKDLKQSGDRHTAEKKIGVLRTHKNGKQIVKTR